MIANAIRSPEIPVSHHAASDDDFIPLIAVVDRHARIVCRHLPASELAEVVAESVAAAFVSYRKLKARGMNPRDFSSRMAAFAVLHAKSGRHVGSHLNRNDVMSRQAQRKHGFKVESLSSATGPSLREQDHGPDRRHADVIEERLHENTRTPPDEQAAFRIDFRQWLHGWNRRERQVIRQLATGARTRDVAAKHKLTPGRISQMRRHFQSDWERFYDEAPALSPV